MRTLTCRGCGNEFEYGGSGRPAKTCVPCKTRVKECTCRGCGVDLVYGGRGQLPKWCSKCRKADALRRVREYQKTDKGKQSIARSRAVREQTKWQEKYRKTRNGTAVHRRANSLARYLSRKGVGPIYYVTNRDIMRIIESPCLGCGITSGIEIDHMLPINRGGSHGIGNLIPLCVACNRSKNNCTWMEWRLYKIRRTQQTQQEVA